MTSCLRNSDRGAAGAAVVLLLWAAAAARAQLGGINAEFAGAGARALSMGGAFIGLADDATAAEFNPAGLWQLRRPEVAAQLVYAIDQRPLGHFYELPSEDVFRFEDDVDRYWIPSFLSVVYPTQHLTLGLSEFTNIDYERSYRHPIEDYRVVESARNRSLGLCAAVGIRDRLSLGATLRYNRFQWESHAPGADSRFEDEAPSFNAGLLWRPTGWLGVGVVYKSPQALENSYHGGDGNYPVDTEIPGTIGAGLAFSPGDAWRVLVDVDRIQWSHFDPNPRDAFVRDDVTRYHAGVEWYAGSWRDSAFLLRAGAYREGPNAFRYTGTNPGFEILTNRKRESLQHLSLGAGVARPRYQLDFGVDLTQNRGQNLITSMVWYF